MKYEDINVDELLADLDKLLADEQKKPQPKTEPRKKSAAAPAGEKKTVPVPKAVPAEEKKAMEVPGEPKPVPNKKKSKKKKRSKGARIAITCLKTLAVVLETVALVVLGLYLALYVVVKGPSPTARDLVVMSLRETSAMGWLPNLYFTPEEIAAIENKQPVEDFNETDTSLIQIPKETEPAEGETLPENQGPQADEWGLIDEDGDGIIIEEVKGEGYSGYMMVVLDPSRVIMGSVPTSYGGRGYTVADMVAKFDAVAGINAGGFEDPNGSGNGSIPNTMVVFEGKVYYEHKGVSKGFVGFDSNHIMHVATRITSTEIREKGIQYGVCFGPVLIANGEPCEINISGVNPRTAIGQRSDGAVLMLVIDGRQVISMGATHEDLIDIMLDYGAVNACNLDGGSSSLMWFGGDYVNNCASVIGIRPVPTTFLVMKEGVDGNG